MPLILHSLPYFVSAWLFCCGLWGVITSRHLVHTVVCLAILQSSTYVLLLGIGYRIGGTAPVFSDIAPSRLTVDPVVQAPHADGCRRRSRRRRPSARHGRPSARTIRQCLPRRP